MRLDHEGLEVYQVALDFLVIANAIIEGLPRGRGHLSDQFTRASLSIVLNIAEGAGKHSKPDKRRYYLTARGSATESAALLDVCYRLKLLEDKDLQAGKDPHRVDAGQAGSQLRRELTPRFAAKAEHTRGRPRLGSCEVFFRSGSRNAAPV